MRGEGGGRECMCEKSKSQCICESEFRKLKNILPKVHTMIRLSNQKYTDLKQTQLTNLISVISLETV